MAGLWSLSDSRLELDLHPGQARAWQSRKRFVAVLAGTQGGKTSFLPWLLWREIQVCGPGDYIAATATYDLFKLKFLPALREVFEHITGWGRYWSGDRVIELSDPTTGQFLARRADDAMWARIILRSAESGAGLESTSARAAVLDEAGMPQFQLDAWEAVQRRLSLAQGRAFLGTTLYDMGWVKSRLYDPWEQAKGRHPEIDVIQFDSTENPAFPAEEYERASRELPRWKFDMFYRGRYTRPAGMVYDCWDRAVHTCPRFALPPEWPRFGGLDFGGVHTAGLHLAQELGGDGEPTGRLFVHREYLAGERTTAQHAAELLKDEPTTPIFVGGAASEGQWRREFRAAGLPVREPDQPSVEVGITRVYGALKARELVVFDDLAGLIGEIESYRRVLDAAGEPLEAIADKSTYHRLDALRYIVGWLRRSNRPGVR